MDESLNSKCFADRPTSLSLLTAVPSIHTVKTNRGALEGSTRCSIRSERNSTARSMRGAMRTGASKKGSSSSSPPSSRRASRYNGSHCAFLTRRQTKRQHARSSFSTRSSVSPCAAPVRSSQVRCVGALSVSCRARFGGASCAVPPWAVHLAVWTRSASRSSAGPAMTVIVTPRLRLAADLAQSRLTLWILAAGADQPIQMRRP